jgi:hypothetical protein
MDDTFDMAQLTGESSLLFYHAAAQAYFGASVFWLRRLAALGGEQTTIEYLANQTRWQSKGYYRNYRGVVMIANDQELQVTLERITRFQTQLAHLRNVESNPANYHAAASGFLSEIDRMQLEVRDYLSIHPAELEAVI